MEIFCHFLRFQTSLHRWFSSHLKIHICLYLQIREHSLEDTHLRMNHARAIRINRTPTRNSFCLYLHVELFKLFIKDMSCCPSHTQTYTSACARPRAHTHTYTHSLSHMHARAREHSNTHTHPNTHAHAQTLYTPNTHTHTHSHTHTHRTCPRPCFLPGLPGRAKKSTSRKMTLLLLGYCKENNLSFKATWSTPVKQKHKKDELVRMNKEHFFNICLHDTWQSRPPPKKTNSKQPNQKMWVGSRETGGGNIQYQPSRLSAIPSIFCCCM